jgi:8-amino-7-oxononanoate synthase
MSIAGRLARGLAALDRDGLRRSRRILDGPQGARISSSGATLLNFSSNDYLGLASDARLREAAHRAIDEMGVGAGASALVSGHSRLHEQAEQRFARFAGVPRALLFASGYAANLGILATLGDRDAEIFSDDLNHACLIDGARLSRAAVTRYPHRDLETLDKALELSTAATRIVATDAVFSMDGDIAPVAELLALCERHDAWLVLDDAHGIGVVGDGGHGTLERFGIRSSRVVYMATLGKALGGYGAFVGAEPEVIEWLMQRARTYIYTTALPPMAAAVAMRAMDLVDSDRSLVTKLHARIAQFRDECERRGIHAGISETAIHPIVVGTPETAVEASGELARRGLLVPAIRPPSVPAGTSRLRVSLTASHTEDDVAQLAAALAQCVPR